MDGWCESSPLVGWNPFALWRMSKALEGSWLVFWIDPELWRQLNAARWGGVTLLVSGAASTYQALAVAYGLPALPVGKEQLLSLMSPGSGKRLGLSPPPCIHGSSTSRMIDDDSSNYNISKKINPRSATPPLGTWNSHPRLAVHDNPGVCTGEFGNYYGFPSWSPQPGACHAIAPPLPGYPMPWNPYALSHPAMVQPPSFGGGPQLLQIGGAGGNAMLGAAGGQMVIYDARNATNAPPKLIPSTPSIQILPLGN